MDSTKLASMTAEVVRGVEKSASLYAGANAEAGRLWDQLEAEVAEGRKRKGVEFDIPNEIPQDI